MTGIVSAHLLLLILEALHTKLLLRMKWIKTYEVCDKHMTQGFGAGWVACSFIQHHTSNAQQGSLV